MNGCGYHYTGKIPSKIEENCGKGTKIHKLALNMYRQPIHIIQCFMSKLSITCENSTANHLPLIIQIKKCHFFLYKFCKFFMLYKDDAKNKQLTIILEEKKKGKKKTNNHNHLTHIYR